MPNHRQFKKKIYCASCGRPLISFHIDTWPEASAHKCDILVTCDKPCEKSTPLNLTGHEIYQKYHQNKPRPVFTVQPQGYSGSMITEGISK